MKVVKWLELEKYYKEETEKARLEMIEAIKERDLVFSEIKEQRNWLKIVKSTINTNENKKWQLIIDLKGIETDFNNSRETLEKNIYNYIETSNKVSLSLNKNIKQLDIIKKEIEINKINLKKTKIKQKLLKDLKNEISKLENQKNKLEIELDEKEKGLIFDQEQLNEEKFQFKDFIDQINKKEIKLWIKEERLNQLEQKLFSNK